LKKRTIKIIIAKGGATKEDLRDLVQNLLSKYPS
jgi:hypothetical protein